MAYDADVFLKRLNQNGETGLEKWSCLDNAVHGGCPHFTFCAVR